MTKAIINHNTKEIRIITEDNGLTAIIKFEHIQILKHTSCNGDYFSIRIGYLYNKHFMGNSAIFVKNYEIE